MMSTNDAYDNYFSKANTDVSDQLVLMLFNSAEAFDLQKVHAVWVADSGDDITNSITITWRCSRLTDFWSISCVRITQRSPSQA